jgi:hypothetical protein
MEDKLKGDAGSETQPKLTVKPSLLRPTWIPRRPTATVRSPPNRLATKGTTITLDRLGEALDATKSQPFPTKEGKVIYAEPVPDHKNRLQAVEITFKLRGKWSVDAPEQMEDEGGDHPAVQVEDLDEADRALLHQAMEIDAELAEIDKEDGGGDHGTDQ